MIDLLTAFLKVLQYNRIQPESVREVEHNVGVIWFKDESGITYCVSVQTVEHELDEEPRSDPF